MINTACLIHYMILSVSFSMTWNICSHGLLKEFMTDSLRAEAHEMFLAKISHSGPDSTPKI